MYQKGIQIANAAHRSGKGLIEGGMVAMNEEAALLRAYRETEYIVFTEPALTLRVDEVSPALLQLHQASGVRASAYVTACNPGSRRLSDAENADRQARLRLAVEQRGNTFFDGIGLHPGGDWPGETSLLLLGLELPEAVSLGRAWGQRAILWAGVDAIPRLIFID